MYIKFLPGFSLEWRISCRIVLPCTLLALVWSAGRIRAFDSLEFHRKAVLGKEAPLADVRWTLLCAAQTSCLQPEKAGLQLCARFCLVYHGYCCRENFVLLLNIPSPTHMQNHNAHTQSGRRCRACLFGIWRNFRGINGSQRTVRGKDTLTIKGDAASQENDAEKEG